MLSIADTVVLALMPGSGDSIQALKAGIMEIPDVIAINKMDHPMAKTMLNEVRQVLALGPHEDWTPPIVLTEAVRGEGVDDAVGEDRRAPRLARGRRRARTPPPRATLQPRSSRSPRPARAATSS